MIGTKDVLLDSNIVVYSSNTLDPNYERAKKFISELEKNKLISVLAHQNIFESIRILTHPKYQSPMSYKVAVAQLKIFKSFSKIIYPTFQTDEIAFELIKKYKLKSNAIFDCYLVATMVSNGIKYIATKNIKDFEFYEEIKVLSSF